MRQRAEVGDGQKASYGRPLRHVQAQARVARAGSHLRFAHVRVQASPLVALAWEARYDRTEDDVLPMRFAHSNVRLLLRCVGVLAGDCPILGC